MKAYRIILIVSCFAFSLNLMANEVIKLTWQAIMIHQGYYYDKYITIIVPKNKTFTVDWGDGSNIETKIGTGDKQILKYSYADTKSYTATLTGIGNDCLFTYLDCTNIGVTKLNIASNVSLKTLLCNHNWLTELDINNCSALEYLDCSYNSLSELDISTNTALKHLDCHFNDSWVNMQGSGRGISYLDFGNCELTYLDCSYNSLLLSNLYVASEMIGDVDSISFSHQTLPCKKIVTGTPIDFSSEKEFGGIATTFDVRKDCDNLIAIEGVDFTINDGIITFLKKETCNSGYIITLTNAAIPTASLRASFYTFDFMHILSELTVSEGTLKPDFDGINFSYIVNVKEDVSEITISAIPNNPNTIVSGTGTKTLKKGENIFIINALTWYTENEGTSLDYKIRVIRGTINSTDSSQLSKIKIYPNPASNFIEIDFANNFKQYQSLNVYDLIGKLCLTVAVTQEKQKINIQDFPIGIYIVHAVGRDKRDVSEKLLILR